MLSRLNPEHILPCSELLNISNSLSLTDLIISFICVWILPDKYRQLFLPQLWAHSQSVLLRIGRLCTAIKQETSWNDLDDSYFSFCFQVDRQWFYCFFWSKTYRKQIFVHRLRGAMVARLTPDRKVTCSSHVVVSSSFFVHSTGLGFTGILRRKKAASATAFNPLLNATSSQPGSYSWVWKSSQYQ